VASTTGRAERRPARPTLSPVSDRAVTIKDLKHLLDAIVTVGSELSLPAVLSRIVEAATDLVDATYCALGVLDETGTSLAQFLTVGVDDETHAAIGDLPHGHGILGLLIVEPKPLRLDDLSEHPDSYGFPPHHPHMTTFLGVPVRVRGQVFGNLYLTNKRNGEPFDDIDEELAVGLAAAAGVAIENTRLHSRLGDLMVLEDRERIARDLHDTVIQRLFATGLALQGIAARDPDPTVAERLQAAVDDLDDTVRHIRTTIFELQRQRLPGRSLRQEVLDLLTESTELLGFEPLVRFDGAIDLSIDDDLADHVLAVLREAASNVAKHADATSLEVRLSIVDDVVCLDIVDNGRGPDGTAGEAREEMGVDGRDDSGPSGGHGLRNMRARAERAGGSLEVRPADSGGTWIRWRAPVRR
jgi:signal transduction histidine kinase